MTVCLVWPASSDHAPMGPGGELLAPDESDRLHDTAVDHDARASMSATRATLFMFPEKALPDA